MDSPTKLNTKKHLFKRGRKNRSLSDNTVYVIGFIGTAIYYVSCSTSFWAGALGILKAVLWPVFLVYGLFQYINI
jgi:hypothetical protein